MTCALTREQFEAAELLVRREISARVRTIDRGANVRQEDRTDFDPEELRLLDYFIERSFRLGRTAAHFRSYRQLGRATQTFTHAHEAFKRLVNKKVLAPLPFSTKQLPRDERHSTEGCSYWYGFNLNFSLWPKKQDRPAEFWEQPEFANELEDALRETFIELSAGSTTVAPTTGTDRAPGSVSVSHADKGGPEINSPARPVSAGDSKTETPVPQPKPENWADKFARLKHALTHGLPLDEFLEDASVPSQGTQASPTEGTHPYPNPACPSPGYATKPNKDAARAHAVPSQGTYPYIASLALSKKAELAKGRVPPEGTRTPEKVAMALAWLQTVDTTGGLKLTRFAERWEAACELYPDYVLNRLRGAFEQHMQRLKQGDPDLDPIANPLGWLATKACDDGRMKRFRKR